MCLDIYLHILEGTNQSNKYIITSKKKNLMECNHLHTIVIIWVAVERVRIIKNGYVGSNKLLEGWLTKYILKQQEYSWGF